jgi:hypothetical protein
MNDYGKEALLSAGKRICEYTMDQINKLMEKSINNPVFDEEVIIDMNNTENGITCHDCNYCMSCKDGDHDEFACVLSQGYLESFKICDVFKEKLNG